MKYLAFTLAFCFLASTLRAYSVDPPYAEYEVVQFSSNSITKHLRNVESQIGGPVYFTSPFQNKWELPTICRGINFLFTYNHEAWNMEFNQHGLDFCDNSGSRIEVTLRRMIHHSQEKLIEVGETRPNSFKIYQPDGKWALLERRNSGQWKLFVEGTHTFGLIEASAPIDKEDIPEFKKVFLQVSPYSVILTACQRHQLSLSESTIVSFKHLKSCSASLVKIEEHVLECFK